MADEDDQLGTAALRRTVAATRAVAGAGGRLAPAPPPDLSATPWAPQPQPAPARNNGPLPTPQPPPAAAQSAPTGRRGKVVEPPPTQKQEHAWSIAHRLLKTYSDEIGGNASKAELHLAQGLMKNGTLLVRYGLPMESLSALIRLARDLAHNAGSEGHEDPAIEELRKQLERDDASLPVGQVYTYEGDENGEEQS